MVSGVCDSRRRDRSGADRVRGRDDAVDGRKSAQHLRHHLPRRVRHRPEILGHVPESRRPARHFAGGHARVQNALLEHRRGGSGPDRLSGDGRLHDLPRGQAPKRSADSGHARRRRCGGCAVGLPPVLLQGEVEHQRNAVHPHDELHCDPARSVLHHHLGGSEGRGQDRRHQSELRGGLAAGHRRAEVPAGHSGRGRHDAPDVCLPQLQQARL